MLLGAARTTPCWRFTKPFIQPARVVPRSTPWRSAYRGSQLRIFTSSQSPLRKQAEGDKKADLKTATTTAAAQDQKTTQNATATNKKDLLSETSVGVKEQRKADWAIMKEMAKYLWPKVRTDRRVTRSTDIDWILQYRMTGAPNFVSEVLYHCLSAQRCVWNCHCTISSSIAI